MGYSMLNWQCGSCGEPMEAPEELAGQTIDCPKCGQVSKAHQQGCVTTLQRPQNRDLVQQVRVNSRQGLEKRILESYMSHRIRLPDGSPLHCPKCQSASVQQFSLIFAGGTTTSDIQISGLAFDADGLGFVGGGGSTTSATHAARLCAPPAVPQEPDIGWAICIVCLCLVVGLICLFAISGAWDKNHASETIGPSVVFWLLAMGVAAGVIWSYRDRSNRCRDQMWAREIESRVWQNSYLCQRCACEFVWAAQ